jgi:4-aminobutyrate aminotransferase-like enzyme
VGLNSKQLKGVSMASSEGIAAADLVEKVPSSRQVRYEGRLMNIEAVQRAEKEMDEAETAVEQEHQLAMKGVAEEEAALRLRLQTILARKEALAQR